MPNEASHLSKAQIYGRPLPVAIHPLPAVIPHNPLSIIRVTFLYLQHLFSSSSSHPLRNAPGTLRGKYVAYYDALTCSVHVTEDAAIRALWEQGFFGKGSLSRSEPEWLEQQTKLQHAREKELRAADPRLDTNGAVKGLTSWEVTQRRRRGFQQAKWERAAREAEAVQEQLKKEGQVPDSDRANLVPDEADSDVSGRQESKTIEDATNLISLNIEKKDTALSTAEHEKKSEVEIPNREHLQLTPIETFFLVYGLDILAVCDQETQKELSIQDLFFLFQQTSTFPPPGVPAGYFHPDNDFVVHYVVYHHFRSLGWVVRPGIKFAVDLLLYHRGPVFSHAAFAVLVLPSYSHRKWKESTALRRHIQDKEPKDWWYLHAVNRVQAQVRKGLIFVYVDIPPPGLPETQPSDDISTLLRQYRVREFHVGRWTPNRSRS